MKVAAATVPDAASDPQHPDHARWVKETTLAMEVAHAQRVGGTFRDAENENNRLLERMEAIARAPKFAPRKVANKAPRKAREQRVIERGVVTRVARKPPTRHELSPCGRCGLCRRCKREKRVYAMILKARAGDMYYAQIVLNLHVYATHAKNGTGPFLGMNPRDANKAVIRRLEDICDASIMTMGPWR